MTRDDYQFMKSPPHTTYSRYILTQDDEMCRYLLALNDEVRKYRGRAPGRVQRTFTM